MSSETRDTPQADPAQGQSAQHVQAKFQQALKLHQAGRLADAQALYEEILKLQPDHFDSLHLRGVVLIQAGRQEEGIQVINEAIEVNPNVASAYNNRGSALHDLKRPDEALASYDKALALKPDFAEVHYNRGNALRDLHRPDEALASYDKALALKPDYVEVHNNRGNALRDLHRPDEALASYDMALALKPDFAEVYSGRGNALKDLQRLDEALASYDKALLLKPDCEFLFGTYLHIRMRLCDWSGLEQNLARYSNDIAAAKKVTTLFPLLSLLDNPELHKTAAKVYAETRHPRSRALGPFIGRKPDGKLRIGYYSADFHNHATAHLMAELLEEHRAERFELYGFSFGPGRDDDMRRRVSSAFDKFIDVSEMSDRQAARLSRELGIDIAVDLKGYTHDARTGIFAEGCAPVQVSYLGYPGTLGTEYIDYVIADKTVIPMERQSDFTEKVVYLPHCYQVNDSKRRISDRKFTRQELELPEPAFVYCCFNASYKILPTTFDAWIRILQAVEGSVLWLFEDNPTAAKNLRKEAVTRGLDARRLVFAKHMPSDEHLARYRQADLFLDTLPCNAHTTASDALWAGLPVLTCMGKSFAGRVAASLLRAVGLPELVTQSQQEYEAKAIHVARNPEMLRELKSKLERNRSTTPLFDGKLFAKHIEAAYEAMYSRYRAGLPPAAIEIEP